MNRVSEDFLKENWQKERAFVGYKFNHVIFNDFIRRMDNTLLLVGSKPNNFNIDECLDYFKHNIRFNLGLPGNNNGTKYDMLLMNCHVSSNIRRGRQTFLNKYKSMVIKSHIELFYDNYSKFKKYDYNRLQDKGRMNSILKKYNIPIRFNKQLRLGMSPILHSLMGKEKRKIYLFGYSLPGNDEVSYYSSKKSHNNTHEIEKEHLLIKHLHNKGLIDATLCCIEKKIENKIYLRDNIIEPTKECLNILVKFYNIVVLKN
jgi:hypothetical protein